jgi:hypothetical protein
MAANKVVLGTGTLIDLTGDTATPADVAAWATLHLSNGEPAEGTARYAGAPENNGNAVRTNGILYAAVDSTSTSTKFTATVDGLTELYDGACVMLHNGVVTSAKNFTVNVNGLGAKKCYSNMTNATQETTIFNAAYTLMFVYSTALDGGNGGWWIYRGYDANTTYTPVKLGFGYGHCTTATATAAKAVAISGYVLNTGGIVSVLFDHDVQAGATLNVTSKGAKAIYYKGAAIANGVIKAGDTATFMYSGQYHLLSIDRWGSDIDGKQDTLVSGTNIKTVNGTSLLGSGNISTAELPAVTAADNGKVLMVVDGIWQVASLPIASDNAFGVVKVDGTTITATDGVISTAGGAETYEVTITLTNPSSGQYFEKCNIYGYDTTAEETTVLLGEIDSPTGSTTVEYDPSLHEKLSVGFSASWGVAYDAQSITCTGGVSFYNFDRFNIAIFNVEGDGTITFDGIDYGD